MPEYLAPGVFVEEVSFRSKSIEGVSTTTTGFVGPTRFGPSDGQPEILTSLADYERIYGDGQPLLFGGKLLPNDMWHAVRAFFDNGGARLYVARVTSDAHPATGKFGSPIGDPGPGVEPVVVRARYPGAAGERRVRITLEVGQNLLTGDGTARRPSGAAGRDVVLVSLPADDPANTKNAFALATWTPADDGVAWSLRAPFILDGDGKATSDDGVTGIADAKPFSDLPATAQVSLVTATVTDLPAGGDVGGTWNGLALDPDHQTAGEDDSLFDRFAARPRRRSDALSVPVVIELATIPGPAVELDGIAILKAVLTEHPTLQAKLLDRGSKALDRSFTVELAGGTDGGRPGSDEYKGREDPKTGLKTGLVAFQDLEDISIVAAPGSTRGYTDNKAEADSTIDELIGHCERMRYRIAVLDSGDGQSLTGVREMRARLDSKHAALYYPWIVVMDPITRSEAVMPPSGFVAGIYARNDRQRAVYKAPANEVVTGALRFETMLNRAQQEVLNPEGINCFRFFEGRGNRLWGARTISSDPEWKYVNLRRYFAYLERSIDIGTQWAVFEPNGEQLWGNVRRTIEDFLFNEFQMGALLGEKPEKAYFVKCDRSTMTQNDLDNGRLVCLIGVAPLRPAEFVIFRIGQWTADRKV
jgi:uncharacterized protein